MNILEMCENMDICELFKQLEEENDVEVIEMDDEEVTDEEVLDIFINEDGCGNSVMDSLMIASIAFDLFKQDPLNKKRVEAIMAYFNNLELEMSQIRTFLHEIKNPHDRD